MTGGKLLAQPDLRLQHLRRGQGQRSDAADGPPRCYSTHGGRQEHVAHIIHSALHCSWDFVLRVLNRPLGDLTLPFVGVGVHSVHLVLEAEESQEFDDLCVVLLAFIIHSWPSRLVALNFVFRLLFIFSPSKTFLRFIL